MEQIPHEAKAYKKTALFSNESVPESLLNFHLIQDKTWATINVQSGALIYRILSPVIEEIRLDPDHPGVVSPGVPHRVEFFCPVTFYLEFYRIPASLDDLRKSIR
ncbi:MAG: DUF1971 domain-containing protein [Pseudomonadota bacterium]|nr:DUF1971 domain-containing protein [Pseudomonadota bacterium]